MGAATSPNLDSQSKDPSATMLSRSLALARASRAACRQLSTKAPVATLPKLPYDYAALEPIVSEEIMTIHHSKHHQAYVTNLNLTNEKIAAAEAANDAAAVKAGASALNFNGGGHINHSIFWTNLCPPKDFKPCQGELLAEITKTFGGGPGVRMGLARVRPENQDAQGNNDGEPGRP